MVFGPLRGGTTLLRLMLDGHPGLSCIGESDYLFDHLSRTGAGWRYDRRALAEDRIFRASGLPVPDAADGAVALHDLVRRIGRDGTLPVLMLHRHLEAAATLLPEARILRLTRDPRDSARSAVGMGWAGNVFHGVESWTRTERSWQAFEAGGHPNPVHRLRYEDLVAEPEARLAELCDFVGVPYDPGLLAYPGTTTYDRPDASLAFQWRRKQTPAELALVEHRLGPLLVQSGYEPSGHPPRAPTRAERVRLGLQNRAAVWRFLIGRYGPVAPVLRGLGRRLRLDGLERLAQGSMDKTAMRHLK